MRTAASFRAAPAHSVKALLARVSPALTRVTDQAARTNFWSEWLESHLAPEIRPRISGVVENGPRLTIFAESAAWSARLRFALPELEQQIRAQRPDIAEVTVRVRPRP